MKKWRYRKGLSLDEQALDELGGPSFDLILFCLYDYGVSHLIPNNHVLSQRVKDNMRELAKGYAEANRDMILVVARETVSKHGLGCVDVIMEGLRGKFEEYAKPLMVPTYESWQPGER